MFLRVGSSNQRNFSSSSTGQTSRHCSTRPARVGFLDQVEIRSDRLPHPAQVGHEVFDGDSELAETAAHPELECRVAVLLVTHGFLDQVLGAREAGVLAPGELAAAGVDAHARLRLGIDCQQPV